MNRIAIILRQVRGTNLFREAIYRTLRLASIDSAVICSGFFQESDSYSASESFEVGDLGPRPRIKLTTVGLYNRGQLDQYLTFGSGLFAFNNAKEIKVSQRVLKSPRWHAKVFIAKSKNVPKLAIIGSSNITRPAFDISTPFNHECDVIFWDEDDKKINKLMDDVIALNNGDPVGPSVFVALYDNMHTANKMSLSKKLLCLEKQIFKITKKI